jgi:hypothetical protein
MKTIWSPLPLSWRESADDSAVTEPIASPRPLSRFDPLALSVARHALEEAERFSASGKLDGLVRERVEAALRVLARVAGLDSRQLAVLGAMLTDNATGGVTEWDLAVERGDVSDEPGLSCERDLRAVEAE